MDYSGEPHEDELKNIVCLYQAVVWRFWKRFWAYRKGAAVFPGAYGDFMSDSTVSKLLRESHIPGTLHGIARASFRSWCAEQNVAREVAESCLAHSPGGVEASYQRSDLFEQTTGRDATVGKLFDNQTYVE